MSNLVCLKHRDYKGQTAPTLSCTTCCSIYIENIKSQREERIQSSVEETKTWIEKKRTEAISGYRKKNSKNNSNIFSKLFDPSSI